MRKVDKEGKIDFFGTPPKAVFISGQKRLKREIDLAKNWIQKRKHNNKSHLMFF